MKPGTVKPTDVSQVVPLDQTAPTVEVERVEDKKRVNVDELPDQARSQLPPRAASSVETPGESPLVRNRVRTGEEPGRTKGKRQKFLKVVEAKNLSKAARAAFKTLSDLLTRAASILGRLGRKLLDDDEDEDEQQRRRRHHDRAIEDVEGEKIEPSEVPRGLKPLPT
jgi:hypothetical protein